MIDMEVAQIDPVCGMKVLPPKAVATVEHGGRTWYFCGKGCAAKFEAAPSRYDGSQPAPLVTLTSKVPSRTASASVQYTCPMHPEILRAGPGSCPKCGMALEPLTAIAN